jgi:hypothetical protein
MVEYGGNPLCVEHHLMMQQAAYLQMSQIAAHVNFLEEEIARGTGYILPPNRIEIPRPPFLGDRLTLNNINVSKSTIGAINTGTVQHLDASITLLERRGESQIAAAVKELTQAIVDSNEIDASAKNEIAEQLVFLIAQVGAKSEERSIGIARSVLAGISSLLGHTASLVTLWDKLRPLIEKGISTPS